MDRVYGPLGTINVLNIFHCNLSIRFVKLKLDLIVELQEWVVWNH